MSRDQTDWEKGSDGKYRRSARGYDATITIEADGRATLNVVGAGAPADATYDTRRNAMTAFTHYLETKPVS